MSPVTAEVQLRSFVLVQLGKRKMALAAGSVVELVAPTKEQQVPHRTPWLSGVILRRGRVIPVCDVSRLLSEETAPSNCFHLIVEIQLNGARSRDWYAIPVAGECVLSSPEATTSAEGRPEYVAELIPSGDEQIEVLDLNRLISQQESAFAAASQGGRT